MAKGSFDLIMLNIPYYRKLMLAEICPPKFLRNLIFFTPMKEDNDEEFRQYL